MIKKCLVIGYINKNLGDDLFFKILFNRYPNVEFYFYPPSLLLNDYKKIYRKNSNVIFYDKEEYYINEKRNLVDNNTAINLFPMICEKAKEVDCYINIGGSIFIQNKNWKDDDRFIIKNIIGNKPSFILGCNYGPGDDEYHKYLKRWFKKFDDICFRDQESYELFKSLKNTRLADDIVLIDDDKDINTKRYGLAISVIDVENNPKLKNHKIDYYNYIRNIISLFISKNIGVTMYSFCEEDGDLKAINEILEEVPIEERRYIRIKNYKNNIDAFLNDWKKHEYVVATRFHAMILALKYYQIFLPLVYSDKTTNYLKNLSPKIKMVNINRLKTPSPKTFDFTRVKKEYNSEKQFEILDNYLKRGE